MSAELFAELAGICPAAGSPHDIVTVVVDTVPIGKRFFLVDGKPDKKSTVSISDAMACQYHVPDLDTLERLLECVSEHTNAAVTNCGWKPLPVGQPFRMVSRKALEAAGLDTEAVHLVDGVRTLARLKHHSTPSCWLLVDRDTDRFTPTEYAGMTYEAWRVAMDQLLPGFSGTACLRAHSSSSRVLVPASDSEAGTPVGSGNGHTWVMVSNPEAVGSLRRIVEGNAIIEGKAWLKPKFARDGSGVVGQMWTTICDPAVWVAGRLVFNGKPVADDPLTVVPQRFERLEGNVTLPLATKTPNPLKVLQASHAKGAPVVLTSRTADRLANLTENTELELCDGSVITVGEAIRRGEKLRCQAPFRESVSMAAFFAIDGNGTPFVFDSGTGIKHVLTVHRYGRDTETVIARMSALITACLIDPGNDDLARFVIDAGLIDTALSRSVWNPDKGKLYLMADDGRQLSFTAEQAIKFGFRHHYGNALDNELLEEMVNEKKFAGLMAEQFKHLVEHVVAQRQARLIVMRVDMFATLPSMSFADGVVTVTIPHQPFDEARHLPVADVGRVWADFCQHFPEWPFLVDMLVHSRFVAGTRRRCFIWLHAPSDFGKGLLLAVMQQIGLLVGLTIPEVEKALRGDPSGLDPASFLRAWCVNVDEWKTAKADLKAINDKLTLAPKFLMRTEVELFLKLFTSAADVTSLTQGGAEKQFNERFSYMEAPDARFDDRPLRNEVGSNHYRNCLAAGLARYLNSRVLAKQAMGREAADRDSMESIDAFHNFHLLSAEFGDYADEVQDAANRLRELVREWWDKKDNPSRMRGRFAEALDKCAIGDYKGKKVVQLSHRAIAEFIALFTSNSGEAKMGYEAGKLSMLADQGDAPKAPRYRIGDRNPTRGPIIYVV